MAGHSVYLGKRQAPVTSGLNLAELVGSLSYALDMTEGQPAGHCIRCCWIGTQIGQRLGLEGAELSDLYFALLLKDLGCSSNAARICQLYLTDDIGFKRDFKKIDASLSAALRFVFARTGPEEALSARIRGILNILQNGGEISRELIDTRCHRGADIAAKMHFSTDVQQGIRSLDEHWDGAGKPDGLAGRAIPLYSRIALLAQVVDVFTMEKGPAAARREVEKRVGRWFDPTLVEAFDAVQKQPDFWLHLADRDIEAMVLALPPGQRSVLINEDYLDDVASAFADVVDTKSPFTADHSKRVTLYTDMIAEQVGLGEAHRRWLRRAALLHDVGKLAVSNRILDKPGKPDDAEWAAIKRHPLHSEQILARVSAFADIAPIAGAHHERLDGRGYPYGRIAQDIPIEVRIMTVADVFDALTADRPYRAAMELADAFAILDKDTGTAFDGEYVAALKQGMQRLNASIAA